MRCDDKELSFAFSDNILSFRISADTGSSPAVGSSSIITSGLNRKASDALTFCLVPPDKVRILFIHECIQSETMDEFFIKLYISRSPDVFHHTEDLADGHIVRVTPDLRHITYVLAVGAIMQDILIIECDCRCRIQPCPTCI